METILKKIGDWVSAILLGSTKELIARIDERTNIMLDDLRNIKPKVDDITPKVDILWKDRLAPAQSPRQLNKRGEEILTKSGIKEILDKKTEFLKKLIIDKKSKNPYDAEMAIYDVVSELPKHCPDIMDELKEGAFKVGSEIGDVLFVGSVYFRNKIFSDLGFNLEDLK